MSRLARRVAFTTLSLLVGLLVGCQKVPLREEGGEFDLVAAHWFESEKTQYIFFSISGIRPDQAAVSWPSVFELSLDGAAFTPLDFKTSVHRHRIVPCGQGRLCGSYSLKAERAASSVQVRFRYHADSPLAKVASIGNSTHPAGGGADSQSALMYGVFNSSNDRVQVRVHDNFGTPNNEQIKQFGMVRSFEFSEIRLATVSAGDKLSLMRKTGTPLLFPASVCEDQAVNSPGGSQPRVRFTGSEAWSGERLDPLDSSDVACFRTRSLDQKGNVLVETSALARRNPVLVGDATVLRTPLQEARRIPIVISYCQRSQSDATLISPLFLDYQRFILGFGKAPVDLCFAVGEEELFAGELERVMNRKISDARLAGERSDFIFVLAVNHRLSPIIRRFHQIIASSLDAKLKQEREMVSPRLVGAFVYDSSSAEERDVAPGAGVVWCPRLEPKPGDERAARPSAANANCMGFRGGKADLGIFNFIIPMGPFPTLETYEQHVREVGDKGLTNNPQLFFQAVRTDMNSFSSPEKTITFFDGERITLQKGEGVRFCRERDEEFVLDNIAIKATDENGAEPRLIKVNEANAIGRSGVSRLNFEIGIEWNQPFWGGLTFDIPVEGKVLSVIPLNFTGKGQEKIGDAKWTRSSWPVGSLVQKCTKFCDHPFFDEAGVYQARTSWRDHFGPCPRPIYPEPTP